MGCPYEMVEETEANRTTLCEASERFEDMAPDEARARMASMYETVRRYDVARWADHTFERFDEIGTPDEPPALKAV